MWMPKSIYELFPYFVLFVGGMAIAYAVNLLMVVSGATLILSGGVILKMRHDYRTAQCAACQRELELDLDNHACRSRARS